MPLRSDWSSTTCPIAHAADVLADPRVLLVLREMFSGRLRFDELREATGAADSVLARRLASMTDAGLITRASRQTCGALVIGGRLSTTGAAFVAAMRMLRQVVERG